MNKFIIAFLILFLSSCSSIYESKEGDRFKIEFGNIIEVGKNIEIRSNQLKVIIKDGAPLNRFGVRIQNLEKKAYDTAFDILRFNEETQNYDAFAVGGYWLIKPPANPEYEAFLSADGNEYLPGKYKFVVVVGEGEVIEIIEFVVVHASN